MYVKKSGMAGCAAVICTLLVFGLLVQVADAQEKLYKGITIKALLYAQPAAWAVEKLKGDWERQTGAKVIIETSEYGGLWEKQLMDFMARTGTYDIVAFDIPWNPIHGESGNLLPLGPLMERIGDPGYDIADVVPRVLKLHCTWKGKIIGLPFAPSVNFLFYRKDLLEDPIEKAAFQAKYGYDLRVPETMQQLWDVSEHFTREGLFGWADAPKRGEHATWAWFPFFCAWTDESFLDADNKVIIDSREAVDSLEFFVNLHKFAPSASVSWGHDEVTTLIQTKKVAVALHQAELSSAMENPEESEVVGLIGYAPVPKKKVESAGLGGMAIGLSAYSHNSEAAFKFMEWITNPSTARRVAELGGPPFRRSVINDPELSAKYPYFKAFGAALDAAFARPRIPQYVELSEVVSAAVQAALIKEKTPKSALEDGASKIREMMEKWGYPQ